VTSEPLLVVIDMQEVFRDPESPWATPSFDEIAGAIGRLTEGFGRRVVYTRFVLPERISGSWMPYYERFAEVTRPERAPWFELADPYRSWASETLDKPTFSAWGRELSATGEPATVVLTGVATDCCVISTALEAVDAGAFVRVVADACAGSSREAHEAALSIMGGYAPQIAVTTVDEELDLARDATAS
jgi:nicotinamidase-related amidase